MRDRRELANHIDLLHRELLNIPDEEGIGDGEEKGDRADRRRDRGRNRKRDKMAALVQNSAVALEEVLKDVKGDRVTPRGLEGKKGGEMTDKIQENLMAQG